VVVTTMKRLAVAVAFFAALCFCFPAAAQFNGCSAGFCVQNSAVVGSCTASQSFFLRTTATHTTGDNLDNFICGMVTDGNFSTLDHLWIAQANSTDTLLNIVQNNYNMTVTGSPTFTANSGYTGSNSQLNVPYNISSGGGNYSQNSATNFVLNMTAYVTSTDYGGAFGYKTASTTGSIRTYPHFSNNTYFFNAQTTTQDGIATTANNFYGWTRQSSTTVTYVMEPGASGTATLSSTALQNDTVAYLADANAGSLEHYSGKLGGGGFGGGFTLAQMKQICQRFETYAVAQLGLASFSCSN
jgi:hypothetical protein